MALIIILTMAATGSVVAAQTTPPAAPRTAPRTTSAPSTLTVQVTDKSGNGLQNVAVSVGGPVERSGNTGSNGSVAFQSMRAGTYRLRFEHENYVTLEREVVMARGASDVSVALNPAPAKPAATPPPPAPVAAPTPQKTLRPVDPRMLSIPDFLDRELIKTGPQKTSLIACTDGGAARLLQVRDPLTNQQNDSADQLVYVVAGAGEVRVQERPFKADPGSLVLIPRGAPFAMRREGRNPMITLTIALGSPCTEAEPLAK